MNVKTRGWAHEFRQLLFVTVVSAALALPASAQTEQTSTPGAETAADDSSEQPLDAIVVTAQARTESAQTVPISVAVVGGQEIAEKGMANLAELTAQVPSVRITEAAAGDQLFIRGVGSGLNPGFEQSVGTFIDGVYYGRGRQSASQLLDIQRVEVLKGPQSIYFGNNTIGGALNIATQRPTSEFEGYVRGLHEFDADEYDVQGALNVPVSDVASLRFAGRFNDMDGWVRNTFLERDEQQRRSYTLRASALYEPTEDLTAVLKVEYGRLRELGNLYQVVDCPGVLGIAAPPNCAQAVANASTTGFEDVFDLEKQDTALPPYPAPQFDADNKVHRLRSFDTSLNLDWDAGGGMTLTSISAFTSYLDNRNNVDNDFTPNNIFVVPRREEYRQFSQELRLTSPQGNTLDWVVGAYFQDSHLDLLDKFSTTLAGGASPHTLDVQDQTTLSGFAALTWNITDYLRATGGLRYTRVRKTDEHSVEFFELDWITPLDAASSTVLNNAFGFFESPLQSFKRTDRDLTPSINIEYDIAPRVMLYASYVEGFKAGGFDSLVRVNPANPAAFADAISFDSEKAKSYEAGLKSRLGSDLLFNLAIFRSDYRDLQVSTFDGTAGFLVGNAGKARSQGVDAELRWYPLDGFSFSASATYLDAEYVNFETAQCRFIDPRPNPAAPGACIQTGEPLAYSPEISGSVNANYRTDLTEALELTIGGTANFTSSFFTATDNDPNTLQEGYTKLDARIALGAPDQGWEIALIGRNLTDELTTSQANDLPLGAGSYFRLTERPRSIALQLGYSF